MKNTHPLISWKIEIKLILISCQWAIIYDKCWGSFNIIKLRCRHHKVNTNYSQNWLPEQYVLSWGEYQKSFKHTKKMENGISWIIKWITKELLSQQGFVTFEGQVKSPRIVLDWELVSYSKTNAGRRATYYYNTMVCVRIFLHKVIKLF